MVRHLLFPNVVFNLKKSVGGFLDDLVDDDSLKLVLLGNLLYYHDDPYSMSLIFFSIARQVSFPAPTTSRAAHSSCRITWPD